MKIVFKRDEISLIDGGRDRGTEGGEGRGGDQEDEGRKEEGRGEDEYNREDHVGTHEPSLFGMIGSARTPAR